MTGAPRHATALRCRHDSGPADPAGTRASGEWSRMRFAWAAGLRRFQVGSARASGAGPSSRIRSARRASAHSIRPRCHSATAVAEPVAPTENTEETTSRKALYQSELEHNLQRRGLATAPVTDPTATALSEAQQRRVARVPDPFVPSPATATAANPSLEAPGGNLDAFAALLLGLVGGLVGGAAA